MTTTLPANTPILVGYATCQQKTTDLSQSQEALSLMLEASEKAAKHSGASDALLTQCERIYVPEGMWGYKDPARLIAEKIGANNATSVFAAIGITQQTLMADACKRIQLGEHDVVLVTGGEAKFRSLQATIQGIDVSETTQSDDTTPDVRMQPDAELWLLEETTAGLGMPVSYYSVMESAYRKAKGLSIDENRDQLAQMYSDFSKVASQNPHAWKQDVVEAEHIRNPSAKNKMLAFPYTKLHNTSWNVDQSCAMFFTSVGKAQELGIDESLWIYPHVSTENNAMLAVSQRPDIHRSIGAELAAKAALEHTGANPNDIKILDLYSCFPVAVEIYADAFGIDGRHGYTCTGGMPFAGGPLNNYALQAACRVFELLDASDDKSQFGLTSSVSGLITKQGFGLWSKQAPNKAFDLVDVSEAVSAQEKPLEMISSYQGNASIVGYTVTFQGENPQRAIIIADTEDGKRTVSWSEDEALMQAMMQEEYCGKNVTIDDRIFTAQTAKA